MTWFKVIIVALFCSWSMSGWAQQESVVVKKDPPKTHSPKLAATLSLLPGAGQVYNGKWWKVPIVYGGFAVIGYLYDSQRVDYLESRGYMLWEDRYNNLTNLQSSGANHYLTNGYIAEQEITIKKFMVTPRTHEEIVEVYGRAPEAGVQTFMEDSRKNMELLVFTGVIWYLFNIADAAVDAHLKSFDVGDDISLNAQPEIQYNPYSNQGLTTGLSLKMTFN